METETHPDLAQLLTLSPEDFAAALLRARPPQANPPAMACSQSVVHIATALAKAQGAFPNIPRDRKVTVRMRDKPNGQQGGTYDFTYAPLSTIREKTRPALAENGLAMVQPIILEPTSDGKVVEVLRTILMHCSGEWLACDVPMFKGTGDNQAQAYNSGATYARRLGVTLLLCIAADEDDDGNGGDQEKPGPDYHRQEHTTHRGVFPKQGGGYTKPQGQVQTPQRREPAAQEAKPAAAPADPAGGAFSYLGEGLTDGQVKLLEARAKAAGLVTDAEVFALVGVVTGDNVSDALAALKVAANAALDR